MISKYKKQDIKPASLFVNPDKKFSEDDLFFFFYILTLLINFLYSDSHKSVFYSSSDKRVVAHFPPFDQSATFTQTQLSSSRASTSKSFIWKIYMKVLYESFIGKFYMEVLYESFIWKSYMKVLYESFIQAQNCRHHQ